MWWVYLLLVLWSFTIICKHSLIAFIWFAYIFLGMLHHCFESYGHLFYYRSLATVIAIGISCKCYTKIRISEHWFGSWCAWTGRFPPLLCMFFKKLHLPHLICMIRILDQDWRLINNPMDCNNCEICTNNALDTSFQLPWLFIKHARIQGTFFILTLIAVAIVNKNPSIHNLQGLKQLWDLC